MTDFSKAELTGLPTSFFDVNTKKFFQTAKTRLLDTKVIDQNSILALKGGDDIPKYDTDIDYTYFMQEANFYYLTGIREPGLDLIIDFQNSKITLFYNQPDESTKYWQTVITKEELKKRYNLDVEDKSKFNSWIAQRNPNEIYALSGNNDTSGSKVFAYNFKFEGEFEKLKEKVKENEIIYYVIKECRKVKSEEELELYSFISKATNEAHKEMMKALGSKISCYKNLSDCKDNKNVLYERDIENIFNNYLAETYYTRIWGYPCIAGCGVNGATLHYDINNKKLNDGELFLIDMGTRFCNYVTDVTITIPVNSKFSDKQKDIYELVLKSNRETMSLVKEGVKFAYLDRYSKEIILEGLQKLGYIKEGKSAKELYELGVHKYFYPHRLGHYVGIEVHDVYSYDKEKYYNIDSDILLENNVITIEPGIYFRDFLLEQAFKNKDVAPLLNEEKIRDSFEFGGVRIEDDVIVKKDGFINLNADLPRTVEEIESFMKKKN